MKAADSISQAWAGTRRGRFGKSRATIIALVAAALLVSLSRVDALAAVHTLYSFAPLNADGKTNADGANIWAPLTRYSSNIFYGVASDGGANGSGTLFTIRASGQLTVVHTFSAVDPVTGDNLDGAHPYAGTIAAPDGLLYGSTNAGGTGGDGTVFSYSPTTNTFKVLYSFSQRTSAGTNSDGAVPNGGVIYASDHNLYGTTSYGGPNGSGTIFRITKSGVFTRLHVFAAIPDNGAINKPEGIPYAPLVECPTGTLLGSTAFGGATDNGVLFSISLSGSSYLVTHKFGPRLVGLRCSNVDGGDPVGLVVSPSGAIVGCAAYGGSGDSGTIFQISNFGAFSVLHQIPPVGYDSTCAEGAFPSTPILDASGNIYYTTSSGGRDGHGGVEEFTAAGVPYLRASLFAAQGGDSHAALTISGGSLYGDTTDGGLNGTGSIFVMPLP